MYSTKTIHKNINPNYGQTYTTIGDPYPEQEKRCKTLPERWKNKQLQIPQYPQNAEKGFFTKLHYKPEQYSDLAEAYSKTQPLQNRKLGFGSRDAFKRGEFTSVKATERYRDVLKKESRFMEKVSQEKKKKNLTNNKEEMISLPERYPPKDRHGNDLIEPNFLYDIGRTQVTPYCPKNAHDCFYSIPKHAMVDPKLKGKDPLRRLGSHRPMSMEIGDMAWNHSYTKPEFGQPHFVDKFYDRGHLECKGL